MELRGEIDLLSRFLRHSPNTQLPGSGFSALGVIPLNGDLQAANRR